MTSSTRKTLAVILSVGFVFRILMLGKRQLWTDELIQALVARSSSLPEMMGRLRDGVPLPAPLDFFVQKLFVSLLGDSGWALRFHAVILSTLSLWYFFRIGRRLFGDRIALYSTALLTFYPLHHHYSQEGRPIALVVLLTLISFDLLLEKLRGRMRGARSWFLLALVLVLILYSTLVGILILFAQLAFLVASAAFKGKQNEERTSSDDRETVPDLPAARWGDVAAYTPAAIAACLLFIPWMRHLRGSPVVPPLLPAFSLRIILSTLREIGDNSPFVVLLLLAGALCGALALVRHHRRNSLVVLLSWSGALIIELILVDGLSAGWAAHRFIILASLPLVLMAGYGLSHLGERMVILDSLPYRASSPAIAYIAVFVLASSWIAQSRWKSEPVDWRGTALFLQQEAGSGDVLVMPKTYALLEYYVPALEEFRTDDLDEGRLSKGGSGRCFVVCLDGLHPDPCAEFRGAAVKDRAWVRIDSQRGFTIFRRTGP